MTSRRSTTPTPRRWRQTPPRRSSPAPRRAPGSPPSRTSRTGTASRWPTREAAIAELGGIRSLSVAVRRRLRAQPFEIATEPVERPRYELGEQVATRGAYGDALAWIGSLDERVVALDAEVGNSTYAERFAEKHPERFFEMFIAEQQMVAAAVGFQVRGWKPFASSFGAFLSRAYDFVRMAAISGADLKLCGSHVGVSIGPDGPSQMALEDIASLRAVLGSTVLYPCDANQTVAAPRCDAPATAASAICAPPAAPPRCSTGRMRPSRSAAAARFASSADDRHPDRRRRSPCTSASPPPRSSPAAGSRPG